MGQHLGREDEKQGQTHEMRQHKSEDFQQELIVKHRRKKEAELENTAAAARGIAKKGSMFRHQCPDTQQETSSLWL